ncbi:GntR family transcriptional regulator [Nocardioides sp. T2.26MG-1]|uniref:GntR family transcriptional regulator n=1 Tax=Nocardioides sp. T2.26MG-1 TaxID=3041166 RepID=UPI002477AA66|nr:GntR family transcriptional regulator [Nocardioides sp. T2.26MG-1]CAI9402582.1 HTH-type transcriptional repressor NagR [Nocardioides sp. T2.26MG-1]
MATRQASQGSQATRVVTVGPRPKHAQVRDALAELATTELGPDAAIPSERELMATYAVSRDTVRKAINALVGDGLLVKVHGRGTFVARPRLETQLHLASFSQDMRRRGFTPSTRLLAIELAQPPAEVAKALGLDRTAMAWKVDRVRLADDEPIALENGWHPASLLPGLDRHDLGGSLYELLAHEYGLVIDSAEQTLWGESASEVVAARLDAPAHTPLLVFRRVSKAGPRPVEYVVSRYRGDRYEVHMSLGRDSDPGSTTEGKQQ